MQSREGEADQLRIYKYNAIVTEATASSNAVSDTSSFTASIFVEVVISQ